MRRSSKGKVESPKRTIFVRCGSESLQMVSEPDTGRCASKDAGPQKGGGFRGGPTSIEESKEYQRGR